MEFEKAKIMQAIFVSAQRIIDELPEEAKIGFEGFTEVSDLFGGKSPFDSLNLVAFIVDLEDEIEKAFGVRVALADERVLLQPANPFRTVGSLGAYIGILLSEK